MKVSIAVICLSLLAIAYQLGAYLTLRSLPPERGICDCSGATIPI